jgi:hypothetical protein
VFRTYYGPTHWAFASLDAGKQSALEADILDLLDGSNAGSETLIIPGEYLEVVITKIGAEAIVGAGRLNRPASPPEPKPIPPLAV